MWTSTQPTNCPIVRVCCVPALPARNSSSCAPHPPSCTLVGATRALRWSYSHDAHAHHSDVHCEHLWQPYVGPLRLPACPHTQKASTHLRQAGVRDLARGWRFHLLFPVHHKRLFLRSVLAVPYFFTHALHFFRSFSVRTWICNLSTFALYTSKCFSFQTDCKYLRTCCSVDGSPLKMCLLRL